MTIGILSGGDERDRTADPLLARQVLSQLSYTPTKLYKKFVTAYIYYHLVNRFVNNFYALFQKIIVMNHDRTKNKRTYSRCRKRPLAVPIL